MEKKLQAYYQSLCQPVSKYGFQHEKETMLDGTDVDAQIRKKRAHQFIMAEAFNSQKGRGKGGWSKGTKRPTNKLPSMTQTMKGNSDAIMPLDTSIFLETSITNNTGDGYILEKDGTMIPIQQSKEVQ